jgi:hypothetical protein
MTNECAFKHASGAKGQVSNELLRTYFIVDYAATTALIGHSINDVIFYVFFLIKEPRSVDLNLQ